MSDLAPDATCPCGSNIPMAQCCGPYMDGTADAPTAEALMRSRYTAYVVGALPHLNRSLSVKKRRGFDMDSARDWSESATWQGLEILETVKGGPDDRRGEVEFIARYAMKGKDEVLHERARFEKVSGKWFYVDGLMKSDKPSGGGETVVREAPKVGRNEPCPCGSGKKFKKCCG